MASFLSQSKYMTDLLAHTNMLNYKLVATPMATKQSTIPQSNELYSDVTEYCHIVGMLQYLTLIRPDLSYAVNTVCQYACSYQ